MTSNSLLIKRAYLFEELVKEMFIAFGVEIINENASVELDKGKTEIDLMVSYESKKYVIEVKYSITPKYDKRKFDSAIEKLKLTSDIVEIKNSCLFVFYKVNADVKLDLQKQNIFIYDISILLYIFDRLPHLRERFFELLSYAIDDIDEQAPSDELLGMIMQSYLRTERFGTQYYEEVAKNYRKDFTDQLSSINPGKLDYRKYEKYCKELLIYLFYDSLDRWREQEHSGEDMYIFDIICKIKDNASSFWGLISNKFNSRYIIFEFKNYSDYITQKEIYTTEKYLYKTALRNVAIILTRKGIDLNGKKAIKGALREQGKLILVLNDDDIRDILSNDNIFATEYLEDRLDEFLIELDK